MIPTIEDILARFKSGEYNFDEAMRWIEQHKQLAAEVAAENIIVAESCDYYCGPCNWSGQAVKPSTGHPICPQCESYLSEAPVVDARPRTSYTPLTQDQIDQFHDLLATKMGVINGTPAEINRLRTLCDMARNSRLYGEEIERMRTVEHPLMASARAIIYRAAIAARKMQREKTFAPHAEVRWMLEAIPNMEKWIELSGCVGIGGPDEIAFRDLLEPITWEKKT